MAEAEAEEIEAGSGRPGRDRHRAGLGPLSLLENGARPKPARPSDVVEGMNTSSALPRWLRRAPVVLLLTSAGLLPGLAGCAMEGSVPDPALRPKPRHISFTEAGPNVDLGEPQKAGPHAVPAPSAPGVQGDAPTFTLPTASGQQVSLADLTRRGPAVVFFYRGYWCSSCRAQLRQINGVYEALAKRGVEVAAISVDEPEAAARLTTRIGLRFPVLRDERLNAARAYGAAAEGDDFPDPALVVIRKDGKVHWKQVGELGTGPSFAELVVQRATEAGAGGAR
jgi:peroxiredoxin